MLFIPANKWPAYSPDANPCDYRAWADAAQFVYAAGAIPSIEALRERILLWWDQLPDERAPAAAAEYCQIEGPSNSALA